MNEKWSPDIVLVIPKVDERTQAKLDALWPRLPYIDKDGYFTDRVEPFEYASVEWRWEWRPE